MATIVFRCGTCREMTASRPIYWQDVPADDLDQILGYVHLQVVVACSKCSQVSVLKHRFEDKSESTDLTLSYWTTAFEERDDAYLTTTPDTQWPPVQRQLPFAKVGIEMRDAWHEAERAFAEGSLWTAAGIAYRRFLELGLKLLDPKSDESEPLGKRAARLRDEGHISAELYDLLNTAKAFGNEAAHGAALDMNDAQIARDLCEAFFRSGFSVPFLMERARNHLDRKAVDKARRKKPPRTTP